MKNLQMLMLFGLIFWVLLQIPSSKAFNKDNPTYNINLAPFIQRLSAYYCIHNASSDCPGNFALKVDGWLNISEGETERFCQGGCRHHTEYILKCVWYVNRDYTFENQATIKNLNDTINNGCSQGFTGTSLYPSSGTTATISIVMTLSALALLALFYV